LRELFGERFRPVLVPPWNRIAAALEPELASLGIRALSTFGPRHRQPIVPGLIRLNAHIDIIDWRGTRGFRGVDGVLADTVAHLRMRRAQHMDATEPTGLLSHHLDHDEGCWAFVEAFNARVHAHPAACWIDIDNALG
ncbi:MAG: polysaccharide deacetylase family protein, partial [Gammaproteobacteria bacterium]